MRNIIEPNWNAYLDPALREDIGSGDASIYALAEPNKKVSARFILKENAILCGLSCIADGYALIDPFIETKIRFKDGDRAKQGDEIASVSGSAASILAGERTILNFLSLLCGIATLTNRYVQAVRGYAVRICDTRKTIPGLRELQKYAVRIGGGHNHRMGLYDAVMLKDNHLAAGDEIENMIARARQNIPHTMKIEIEVTTVAQFKQALHADAEIIMLDNMPLEQMEHCVRIGKQKTIIEASGGITLDNVQAVAATGVDIISIGELTHSAPGIDISLELDS